MKKPAYLEDGGGIRVAKIFRMINFSFPHA